MQTKTLVTLLCLSTLSSATAWSMQPGVRLAATAARQQLARSASRRTCMTPLRSEMRQLLNARTTQRSLATEPENGTSKIMRNDLQQDIRDYLQRDREEKDVLRKREEAAKLPNKIVAIVCGVVLFTAIFGGG